MSAVSLLLAVPVLFLAAPVAAGTGRLVRTSLDAPRVEVAAPNPARIIKLTLDDHSHRDLPWGEPDARLIRLSLDEESGFAPLEPAARAERPLRTSLD